MNYRQIIRNNRGMAMLITVSIISILVVVTLELNRRAQSRIASTSASVDRLTLEQIAVSGIHLGIAILLQDKYDDPPTGLDSMQEDWADPDYLSEALSIIPFEQGALTLKITDELGKIQVNSIVKFPEGKEANDSQMFLWERFLTLIKDSGQGFEDIEPRTIINSLKDWLDSKDDDAVTGLSGAETDYYESLDPPYKCKNGPITDVEELVFIKGITPELYYGIKGLMGISDYLTTTFGPLSDEQGAYYRGKININTADLPVIAALLPSGNEILATSIFEYREAFSDSDYIHDLSSPAWYKNAPGLSDVEIDPDLITTFSDFFNIRASATKEETTITVSAVVNRVKDDESGKWTYKILSWSVE